MDKKELWKTMKNPIIPEDKKNCDRCLHRDDVGADGSCGILVGKILCHNIHGFGNDTAWEYIGIKDDDYE